MTETVAPRNARPREKTNKVEGIARWLMPSIGSLSVLLVLYMLVTSAPRFLLDSDTGWHIRTGELILRDGAVPRRDPFSFTMAGREWFAWEWLADVGMARLHAWRGLAGLVAASFLVLLLSFALLQEWMKRRGADPFAALVMTVLGAMATIVHWLARPHLVSILLMVVWGILVERYRRTRSRWIWAVPLLILLWANLHGAFVATFVVLGVYAVGETLELLTREGDPRGEIRQVWRTYAGVGALSVLASLGTPYGIHLYGHLLRYLSDTRLLASISEFQSPNFHSVDGKLIEIVLLLGVIAAGNALRQRRFVEAGLLILWGHMTLQSERHVTMLIVLVGPVIAEQWTLLGAEISDWLAGGVFSASRGFYAVRSWYRDTMEISGQLNGALAYAFIVLFLFWASGGPMAQKLLSPRFDPKRHPVEAADFILHTKPAGNLFSSDQYGGYLIYRLSPEYKVFVDGRSDFYRQGTVLEDVDALLTVKPQWAGVLDRNRIQFMVVKRDEPISLLAQASGQWTVAHQDPTAQVLIRNSSPATQAVSGPANRVR